jgi:serine/threonine protein kinase/tetratricopeptide (TPR) repeat protein
MNANRARDIFMDLVTRVPPERWDARLAELAGNNDELRQRIDRLLAAHRQADSFLEAPAVGEATSAGPDSPVTERPGTVIGPYKLLEQIGEGGFGVVFMAEQVQPVRRRVALKVIKPGMDTRQVIARFEAERQALALMDHPNIARVLDAGATDSGRPYFVMELIKGIPITEHCDNNRVTPRERLQLFVRVCQAVQHAHQKGIIHRDLKPSNVLVMLRDGTPVVKVIDFGVAKATGQQLTERTQFTNFAQLIGTPLYMSPEQAGMNGLDVDTRSDIYSLGVLLYELLTGTTPFAKKRFKEVGYDEMRRIIREEEPPRPSSRISTLGRAATTASTQRRSDPRRLGRLLRREPDWIVMKCLEKDRERRYETAGALAVDVQRYLNNEPVQACPPSVGYRVRKFVRRHRPLVSALVAIALTVVVVTGLVLWQYTVTAHAVANDLIEAETWQKQAQWPKALQALERATVRLEGSMFGSLRAKVEERRRDALVVARLEEANLLASSTDMTSDNSEKAMVDLAYRAAFAEEGLDVLALAAEDAVQRIRSSAIRSELVGALDFWAEFKDKLHDGDGEPIRAVARLCDDDPWRKQLRDPRVYKDSAALQRLSVSKNVLAQPSSTVLLLYVQLCRVNATAAAVRLIRGAQQRHPAVFMYNRELGALLSSGGCTAEGVGFHRAALAIRPYSALAHGDLGCALYARHKTFEALKCWRKAIELKPGFAVAYCNVARILIETYQETYQETPSEAMEAIRKALELRPDSVMAYATLGEALRRQGKLPEAVAACHQAIKLNPDYVSGYCVLAQVLHDQRKLDEAGAICSRAIQLKPDDAEAHRSLGRIFFAQQNFSEAAVSYLKAIELKADDAVAYIELGGVRLKQHKLPEAVAAIRQAIALEPHLAIAYLRLGDMLLAQEKLADAVTAYLTAVELSPTSPEPYYYLGAARKAQRMLPEAVAAFRKAIELKSYYAEAHCYLGLALKEQGLFANALFSLSRGHDLGSRRPDWPYPSAAWVREAQQLVQLDKQLQSLLSGEVVALDATERLKLAKFCQLPSRQLNVAAARFYQEAFANEPKLADDRRTGERYNAACAAALAGCGQGQDAAGLEAKERARLRQTALLWLRADLTAWRSVLKEDQEKASSDLHKMMQRWSLDKDLHGVRDPDALAKLPDAERQKWLKLWRDVEALELLTRVPPEAPASGLPSSIHLRMNQPSGLDGNSRENPRTDINVKDRINPSGAR